ncbi:MAG: anti-sigma factor domain-containing protein [Candidatus Desulforudis sp.]|nr:anti-sigma factor domain-containing protein [Desulforudis sp.]
MESKGLVCRVKPDSAVVMTADFGFVEIRKRPGMEVGGEVRFTSTDLVHRRRPARLFTLAASFAILMLVSFLVLSPFAGEPPVYAYVSVEVNPGVELALDRHLKVVGFRTLNADGAALVRDLDLAGRQAAEAVAVLVRVCLEQGYLGSDIRHLVITTTAVREEVKGDLRPDELLEMVRQELEGAGGRTEVFVLDCGPGVREQAREMTLSTADYLIWEQARKEGAVVESEVVQAGNLRQALTEQGRDFGAAVAAVAAVRARVGPDVDGEGPGQARPPGLQSVPPGQEKKGEEVHPASPARPGLQAPDPAGPTGAASGAGDNDGSSLDGNDGDKSKKKSVKESGFGADDSSGGRAAGYK